MPERMWPSRLAKPAQQSILGRLNENKRRGVLGAQLPQNGGQFFQLLALAHVHEQGRTLNFPAGTHVQFTECGDECNRKIIDAIKTEVFEGFEDGAFARAAKAGEDHQLPGVARVSALHAASLYLDPALVRAGNV